MSRNLVGGGGALAIFVPCSTSNTNLGSSAPLTENSSQDFASAELTTRVYLVTQRWTLACRWPPGPCTPWLLTARNLSRTCWGSATDRIMGFLSEGRIFAEEISNASWAGTQMSQASIEICPWVVYSSSVAIRLPAYWTHMCGLPILASHTP